MRQQANDIRILEDMLCSDAVSSQVLYCLGICVQGFLPSRRQIICNRDYFYNSSRWNQGSLCPFFQNLRSSFQFDILENQDFLKLSIFINIFITFLGHILTIFMFASLLKAKHCQDMTERNDNFT